MKTAKQLIELVVSGSDVIDIVNEDLLVEGSSVSLDVKRQPPGVSSKKKKLGVVIHTGGGVSTDSYWDGGSKDDYAMLDARTKHQVSLSGTSPFSGRRETNIPEGHILVNTSIFQGKEGTPRIIGSVHSLSIYLAPCVMDGSIKPDQIHKLPEDLRVLIDQELERIQK